VSKKIAESLKHDYNTSLTFEYKRFVTDDNYKSYYHTRAMEPIKLELFIAMGYRYNRYLRLIYHRQKFMNMYIVHAVDESELYSIKLVEDF
jgi:hypothetical protein